MRRVAAGAVLLAAMLSPAAPAPAAAPGFVAEPAYYRPALLDGLVFPVARSNFFSLVEFDNGWNAPRFRLVDGTWRLVGVHKGIDIGAEQDTPILSVTPGVVENVGWTFYSGLRVGVRGPDGRYYFYAHLDDPAPGIAEGARVAAGDVLGTVGNTGYGPPGHEDEFPPHLHFGIEGPDGWVNPYPDLVRLYRHAVRTARQAEDRLARLASAGDEAAWRAEADGLYTTFGIPLP
ncbi:MAG TPA: M23 family metallopeptidase [Actinomycetota bacterium]|nr:M23 family metallopeptidase [Actinomycetota bacterium]